MQLTNQWLCSDAKGHLTLLRDFHGKDSRIPEWIMKLERERQWAWFVGIAVERFEWWCQSTKYSTSDSFLAHGLPPCDVLMVWHAYLLNPICVLSRITG
jgi:hypothetical protein